MDVDLVFKIAAIGILVAVLNILLSRAGRDEQALMTTIAGLVVVLVLVIQKISELFDLIKSHKRFMVDAGSHRGQTVTRSREICWKRQIFSFQKRGKHGYF